MEEAVLDRIVLWMISGLSGADLETAVIGKLQVDPAQAKAVIGEARKRLTLAAEYNRDEMLGTALTRLNDLYSRCIRAGAETGPNLAKALDVQREINRLAGLYRGTGTLGPVDQGVNESNDELAAVAGFLLPLGLASESYPLREHARIAAQIVQEYRIKAGQ